MKSNFIRIFLIFFFSCIYLSNIQASDFNFKVTEIEVTKDGNLYNGRNGGVVTTNDGLKVISDSFQYNKITNELEKLMLVVKKDEQITTALIEYHIGISKDYNVFELQNALGKKDVLKANKIINHFAANPKDHHIVPTLGALFSYFQKIMIFGLISESLSISKKIVVGSCPSFSFIG